MGCVAAPEMGRRVEPHAQPVAHVVVAEHHPVVRAIPAFAAADGGLDDHPVALPDTPALERAGARAVDPAENLVTGDAEALKRAPDLGRVVLVHLAARVGRLNRPRPDLNWPGRQAAPGGAEPPVILLVIGTAEPRRLHAENTVFGADLRDRHLAVVEFPRFGQHRREGLVRHPSPPA